MKFLDVIKKYDNILVKENKALMKVYKFLLKEAAEDSLDNETEKTDDIEKEAEELDNEATNTANTTQEDNEKNSGLVDAAKFFGQVEEKEGDTTDDSNTDDSNTETSDESSTDIMDEGDFFNIAEKDKDGEDGEDDKETPPPTKNDNDETTSEGCDEKEDNSIPPGKFFQEEDETQTNEGELTAEDEFFEADKCEVCGKEKCICGEAEKDGDGKKEDDSAKKQPADDSDKKQPVDEADKELAESLKTFVKTNKHLF